MKVCALFSRQGCDDGVKSSPQSQTGLGADFEKRWLGSAVPGALEAAEAAASSQVDEGIFEASSAFAGARAGLVFKTGPRGTGYYQDLKL